MLVCTAGVKELDIRENPMDTCEEHIIALLQFIQFMLLF